MMPKTSLLAALPKVYLTFPPKTTPLAKKRDCAVMGPKEEAYDSKTPYR